MEILGEFIPNLEKANEIIMSARAHWFEDDNLETEKIEPNEQQSAENENSVDTREDAP